MQAAAFQACFTDWRLVKGRKVVQLVFEVPIEAADQAYQTLGGMPDPAQSVWCAVARLQLRDNSRKAGDETGTAASRDDTFMEDTETGRPAPDVVTPASPARATNRFPSLPQRVGMMCANRVFQRFMVEEGKARDIEDVKSGAAVRAYCGVRSRSEIVDGSFAAQKWDRLVGRFDAWRFHDQVVLA